MSWQRLWASPWAAPAAVVLGALVLYLPGAGSYGLWDPWETHYGEVARQMAVRGDYISLWWPCSPRETDVFQTKPVLSYWLMSLSMRLFGLVSPGDGGAPEAFALGTGAEWAVRTPFCLLAALVLLAIYLVTARLAGRRAGLCAAAATATMPMFALLARQAMTDMAFLGMMAPAIALFVMSVEQQGEGELPRLSARTAAIATGALFALAAGPQLLVDSLQLRVRVPWPGGARLMYGVVAVAPYWLGAAGVALYLVRTRQRACLGLVAAATFAGLGVLAKGLAGLALPVLVALVYLLLRGSWRRLAQRELLGALAVGLIVVVVVAVPWHHAMYIRHGAPWWNELFGDNHWRRMVLGRHGDRGSFVYFLRELGYGAWPVAGLALAAFAPLARGGRLSPATALGAAWFVTAYAVVSLSMTKFHHYLLPALPGLAILLGVLCARLLARPAQPTPLVLAGLPIVVAVTADFVARQDTPEKFLWLFSYDYVYSRVGRPWPPELELRPPVVALGIAFTLATLLIAWPRARRAGLGLLLASALGGTLFLIDGFMPRVATAWSQKGTIARYYRERRDAEEHLIAYYMFWRGESFYTKNTIYEGPTDDRTVFDHWRDTDDRLRAFLTQGRHRGRRQFFLFEPAREAHLRRLLPTEAAASFRIIERSNNKFVLAVADL
jgi:4-amino-4-deoxy-L-arabinose transferase-like glycosyltransferase